MDNTRTKRTRQARYTATQKENGKWVVEKFTWAGACEYLMVYEDKDGQLRRSEYETAEKALNARPNSKNRWYH